MNDIIFTDSQIEEIAKILGDETKGGEINRILEKMNIIDFSGESTKWKRLRFVFEGSQRQYKSPNQILNIIKIILEPSKYVNRSNEFNSILDYLNPIISFSGIEYKDDGNFHFVNKAKTLSEAEKRVSTIKLKLKNRNTHFEVLKYCNKELMQENYFHAVFEATKGLAQRIRDMTGSNKDGNKLIDEVFSTTNPIIVMNSLSSETERSEHVGFMNLLKGTFSSIRNPIAHEPKILWSNEDDASDYLSLISMLHRKLDNCHVIRNLQDQSNHYA